MRAYESHRGLGNSKRPDYKPQAAGPANPHCGDRAATGPLAASSRLGRVGREPWRFEGLRQWECGHEDCRKLGMDEARAAQACELSQRSAVPPFIVMDVMEAAAAREAQGHKVIHMEVGQPGTPAPRAALEAVQAGTRPRHAGLHGGPGAAGAAGAHRPATIASATASTVAPERVVVTTGSSAGFVLAFLALFDAGAKVALPSPGYPCYRHILTALGQAPGSPHDRCRFALDADGARRSTKPRRRDGVAGLVIASPANPTGTMLEPGRLAEIVAACRRNKHLAGLRRDLPRPHLRPGRGDRARPLRPGDRDQQLLQVFLDDRLARRLAGGARKRWCGPSSGWPRTSTSRRPPWRRSRPSAPSTASMSSRPTSASTPRTAPCCWTSCPRPGSSASCRPTAPSISTSTSAISPSDSVAFTKEMLDDIGVAATPGVDFDAERGQPLRALLLRRHDGRHGGSGAPSRKAGAASSSAREATDGSIRLLAGLRARLALERHGLPLAFLLTLPIFTFSPSRALAEFFIAASAMKDANPSSMPMPTPPTLHALGRGRRARLSLQQSQGEPCDQCRAYDASSSVPPCRRRRRGPDAGRRPPRRCRYPPHRRPPHARRGHSVRPALWRESVGRCVSAELMPARNTSP